MLDVESVGGTVYDHVPSDLFNEWCLRFLCRILWNLSSTCRHEGDFCEACHGAACKGNMLHADHASLQFGVQGLGGSCGSQFCSSFLACRCYSHCMWKPVANFELQWKSSHVYISYRNIATLFRILCSLCSNGSVAEACAGTCGPLDCACSLVLHGFHCCMLRLLL